MWSGRQVEVCGSALGFGVRPKLSAVFAAPPPPLNAAQETQTKPEGQIHFFPIIMDGKQLYDVMAERCGPSVTSGPKN